MRRIYSQKTEETNEKDCPMGQMDLATGQKKKVKINRTNDCNAAKGCLILCPHKKNGG